LHLYTIHQEKVLQGTFSCQQTLYVIKKNGGEYIMKFYSVQIRETIEVPQDKIQVITMKNGRKAAKATIEKDGKTLKLFKILGKDEK